MKIVLLAHIVLLMIYGCGLIVKRDEVKEFIPGVYVRHYSDEYTDSYDTIQIKLVNRSGSEGYSVIKRTRFRKQTDDGKTIPGYEIKNWFGTYDDHSKTLWLQGPGKQIYFDPTKSELKMGAQPYKKL